MTQKQAREIQKEDFKGSSRQGNLAVGGSRNMKKSLKKTFK
jgi:hypothetical protein